MKKDMMKPSEVKSELSGLRKSNDHPHSDQSSGPKPGRHGKGEGKKGGAKKKKY
jgi:hypothetical protein